MTELKPCPFCGNLFVLRKPKVGVTAIQHYYSEDCPLYSREVQFVNLPIEETAARLNVRPIEDALLEACKKVVAIGEIWAVEGTLSEGEDEVIAIVKAAIAKAEGGA